MCVLQIKCSYTLREVNKDILKIAGKFSTEICWTFDIHICVCSHVWGWRFRMVSSLFVASKLQQHTKNTNSILKQSRGNSNDANAIVDHKASDTQLWFTHRAGSHLRACLAQVQILSLGIQLYFKKKNIERLPLLKV